jgi:hypothetical protein
MNYLLEVYTIFYYNNDEVIIWQLMQLSLLKIPE